MLTFAQNVPGTLNVTDTLNDVTSLPMSPNTGTEQDPSGVVTWKFQKSSNAPPTVAKEVSRTNVQYGIAESYEVGLPYYDDPGNNDVSHFAGRVLHETFSNFSASGFTAANMDPNWLKQQGYDLTTPTATIAQTMVTSEAATGDSQINGNDAFTDTNTLPSYWDGIDSNYLMSANVSISATQMFSCGGNTLLSVQITWTDNKTQLSVSKTK